jgi:hypothetical protein
VGARSVGRSTGRRIGEKIDDWRSTKLAEAKDLRRNFISEGGQAGQGGDARERGILLELLVWMEEIDEMEMPAVDV